MIILDFGIQNPIDILSLQFYIHNKIIKGEIKK